MRTFDLLTLTLRNIGINVPNYELIHQMHFTLKLHLLSDLLVLSDLIHSNVYK